MAFLELSDVRKDFAQSVAVAPLSLQIEQGECISFLGPSGCGKTTTLRMVAGFERPSGGRITLAGADVTNVPPSRRKVGMVFQSYALFPNLNVADNIGFGLKIAGQSASEIAARVREMLELISLPEYSARYPYQLSGGQQQRVALARALAIKPRLLLLDEPLSALDAKIRVSLRNQIRDIQRQLGITTIYVTHDQEEALSLSDRVVVMNRGHVEQVGTPFQVYNAPQTAFVASFVGTLNLLHGTVRDATNGVLDVNGQPLELRRALAPRTNGETVSLALRPEVITLADSASTASGAPLLRGIVEETTFGGPTVRVRVRLANEAVNFDVFNSPVLKLPQIGESVTLTFPTEACLLLDRTSAS